MPEGFFNSGIILLKQDLSEPKRERIPRPLCGGELQLTSVNTIIGPGSIPWEIGNAFSTMFKQDKLTLDEAKKGFEIFVKIPFRYVEPDFVNALKISRQTKMYAYDAYFLDCAVRHKAHFFPLFFRPHASCLFFLTH
ncbi:MAG: type II toxin-antitoxin system VapC family toxin [Desulfobacterales bacterium]